MNTLLFSIIIFVTAIVSVAVTGYLFYLIVKRYFENQQKTQLLQMKVDEHKETLRVITPIRLQAYERMVLFLERTAPASLVMRCYKPGMDAQMLRTELSNTIRQEWEHNLSQQVYISSATWDIVRDAKEQMLSIVNASAQSIDQNATPDTLAGTIFASIANDKNPIDSAINALKNEIRDYFE